MVVVVWCACVGGQGWLPKGTGTPAEWGVCGAKGSGEWGRGAGLVRGLEAKGRQG